jgi:hypothetical protein
MQHRKLGYVLFALAAAGAGCTINGKQLFKLGAPSPAGGGGGGGGGGDGAGFAAAGPAPASYAWCKGYKEEDGGIMLDTALDPSASPGRALPEILQGLCFPDDNARGKRDALEAARKTWMRWLAADEQAWATDIVAWGNLRHEERMDAIQRPVYPKPELAWSTAGPLDQWALIRRRPGDSDDFSQQPGAKYYLADTLSLTEAGRLAFLERCMFPESPSDDPNPVEYAVCQPDLEALDLTKLAAEIRGETGRTLAERMALRAAASAVQKQAAAHAAKVQAFIAKDPAYAKLFEIAKAVRKEWTEPGLRADLLAAVRAMDDARATGSRKALEGCSARMWPLFTAAVGKLPAKRFENLRGDPSHARTFFDVAIGAIVQDPDAYLAASALVACEGVTDHLLGSLAGGLSHWSGFRGPRTATLTAIRLANLTPDRRGEKIDIPSIIVPTTIGRQRRSPEGKGRGSAAGVIATVTDQGDTVRLTFPSTSETQEQCVSHRETNRLSRIDSSGNLHYETVCTRWQRVRVDTTLKPVDVPKRYAAGLAPKRYVSVVAGVPEAVWARPSSPTPLAVFGVLLK